VLAILPPSEEPEELPPEIQDLVHRRDEARKKKDFDLADKIRNDLAARGYTVEDLADGPRIKRKN
jgi:cysteinyl-tRNA synthetase